MASLANLNKEFTDVVKDIMYLSVNMDSPYDRVKVLEWLKKLRTIDESKLELARIRNDYAHFLRILLLYTPVRLCFPFNEAPPETEHIEPLQEVLSNAMAIRCPDLPRTGPIHPVLMHKTTDGKAFMTVKRIPEGGIYCYLAVAPKSFAS